MCIEMKTSPVEEESLSKDMLYIDEWGVEDINLTLQERATRP